MLNKMSQTNKGFTLIEVLVATFMMTVGIGAALTLVNQTTAFTQVISSRLAAAYLAQEGLEIVKNIRDTNFLKIHKGVEGVNWNSGLTGCGGGCYNFDYRSQALPDDTNCSGKTYLIVDSGFYKCSSAASPLRVQRKITITLVGNDVLKVSVEVSWQERGRTHKVTAQETLYKLMQ